MKYTVIWIPAAEQELAAIWLAASDRADVTAAAHALEVALATDSEDKGESRDLGRRVLLHAPLGVLFKVVPDDCIVRVLGVWRFDKRSKSP